MTNSWNHGFRAVTLALVCAASLGAQTPSTGRVTVRVESEGVLLERANVRSGAASAITSAAGVARLTLPAGPQTIRVFLLGYAPDSVTVSVGAGRDTLVTVEMRGIATELEHVIVTSARGATRVESEPTRIEVMGGDDVAEKTEMRPQDLKGFLAEMAGVRVQQTSAATGASGVRLQGLRPRYTLLLADGLPSYGGASGGLDLLQLPPADLRQIEVVKGPASALYGASALGGTINLVSKRPGDESDLLLHGTSENGANAFVWNSRRSTERFGHTVVGGAHAQQLRDFDGDGWADLPEVRRFEARPRLFFDSPSGSSVFLTAGGTFEDRTGGMLPGRDIPGGPCPGGACGGTHYVERADTRRGDVGLVAHRVLGTHGLLQARAAGNMSSQARDFGGQPEDVKRSTAFGELSASFAQEQHSLLVGGAAQLDGANVRQAPSLDYDFTTLSVFAQDAWHPLERFSLTASGRVDQHSRYGTQVSPRLSLLFKLPADLSLRAAATRGFYAPTPFVEETEPVGVRNVGGFASLDVETADYGSLDLTGEAGPLEFDATIFASRIHHPVIASAVGPQFVLSNATANASARGFESFVVYDLEPLFVTALYTYTRALEPNGTTGSTHVAPYAPAHAGGIDVTWEDSHRGTWIAVESFYTSAQELEDDPYSTRGKPYVITGILATQRIGRYKLFANVENVSDVRQTRYSRLLLQSRTATGRWTITPWAPLEGRVFSVGLRISGGDLAKREP